MLFRKKTSYFSKIFISSKISTTEQRYSIKFYLKLVKTGTETIDLLKIAYGDQAPRKTGVLESNRIKDLKKRIDSIEDDARERRPSSGIRAQLVQAYLQKQNINQVPHPLDSPHFAPRDLWLFPNMKNSLRGRPLGYDFELNHALDESL